MLSYYTPSGSRYYKRHAAIIGERNRGKVCVLRGKDRGETDYRERRLAPTSKLGQLQILHVISDCCGFYIVARDTVAVPIHSRQVNELTSKQVEEPEYEPARAQVDEPTEENLSTRLLVYSSTVHLTYPQNQWEVLPDFENNRAELQQIDRLLAPVADNPDYELLSASIVAFASIEDTYQHNLELSDRRARGMLRYIQSRYRLPLRKLTSEGRGEDWDGLREAVAQSDMPCREEVLCIIDQIGIFNGHEKRLMELQHGEPYHYMFRYIFPQLRRMEITITYKTVEQQ